DFDQPVTRLGKFLTRETGTVEELHRKSGGISQSADSARHQGEDLSVAQAAEGLAGPVGDSPRRVLWALSLVPMLEVQVALAGVLARSAPSPAGHEEKR